MSEEEVGAGGSEVGKGARSPRGLGHGGAGFGATWAPAPALTLVCSKPQFPHLQTGNNDPTLTRKAWGKDLEWRL